MRNVAIVYKKSLGLMFFILMKSLIIAKSSDFAKTVNKPLIIYINCIKMIDENEIYGIIFT